MGNTSSQFFTSGAAPHLHDSLVSERPLDKCAWKSIDETAVLARSFIQEGRRLDDFKHLLDSSPHPGEIINLRDMNGCTLLQYAIIRDRREVVEYLLQKGADVNVPICGRPLHLATKLGRVDIVRLLLEYHADPDVLSCVCHPEAHFDSQIVCLPHTEQMHLACQGDVYKPSVKDQFEFPLHYAIAADSVDSVEIFSKLQSVSSGGDSLPMLHSACKAGSKSCVQHFLQQNKDCVNQVDSSGKTPIMYAIGWDKELIELLVLNGALLSVKTKSKQNLLHLLLNTFSFNNFECLKYLLECGMNVNVNAVDSEGNSALNVLLLCLEENRHLIARKYTEFSSSASTQGRRLAKCRYHIIDKTKSVFHQQDCDCKEYFTKEEMQFILCIKLLLNAGINPNIANRSGTTALHIIVRLLDVISFHVVARLSEVSLVDSNDWTQSHYIDLLFIHQLLQSILHAKGNVNLVNNSQHSILTQFVTCGIDAIFNHVRNVRLLPVIEHQVQQFIACLHLLHEAGAPFRIDLGHHTSQVCFLHSTFEVLDKFNSASHLVTCGMNSVHDEVILAWARKVLQLVQDMTQCFLECGLNPNICTDSMQKHMSLVYYKLLTKKPLVAVEQIEAFLKLLLQYGIEVDRNGQHITVTVLLWQSGHRQLPCFPLLHLCNVVGRRYLSEIEPQLLSLMQVLFNSMSEENARQCLRLYLDFDRSIGTAPKYHEWDEYLLAMAHNPSKLKQLCAKFVYRVMARQKMSNVRRLGIPVVLQNYIGSFHY